MRTLAFVILGLLWVPTGHAQQPIHTSGFPSPMHAADTVATAQPNSGADSLHTAPSAAARAAAGALAGAVAGAVLAERDAHCAPSDSPARSSLIGGLWGALRGWLGGTAERRQVPGVGDPPAGHEGPFPFDQDDCRLFSSSGALR